MVRVSKVSPRLVHQQYKQRNRLVNPTFLNLVIVGVILVAISLFGYLWKVEKTSTSESADGVVREAEGTKLIRKEGDPKIERHAKSQEESVKDEKPDPEVDRTTEEEMVPGPLLLPASRVVSMGLPFLVYGTAWKKDDTERLVTQAVKSGFRFIDTACQPKHYNEVGVGLGWSAAARELGLERSDLFLQTKFTSISGQDPKTIPYDKTASLEAQVAQSLEISLRNLQTTYLDSWVMHSPMDTIEETMIVYRVMEQAVDSGKVLRLGISNCYEYDLFTTIFEGARIKPSVLQNRFYGDSNWDQELRAFCKEHSIWYQSFWTLTANRHALATREAKEWALSKQLTPQTLLYAYLMSLGYGTPLDGTTSLDHMREDIAVMERLQGGEKIFADADEIRKFERLLGF
jgi:diketogulonate reductase-like aldo/keto reductase